MKIQFEIEEIDCNGKKSLKNKKHFANEDRNKNWGPNLKWG